MNDTENAIVGIACLLSVVGMVMLVFLSTFEEENNMKWCKNSWIKFIYISAAVQLLLGGFVIAFIFNVIMK